MSLTAFQNYVFGDVQLGLFPQQLDGRAEPYTPATSSLKAAGSQSGGRMGGIRCGILSGGRFRSQEQDVEEEQLNG